MTIKPVTIRLYPDRSLYYVVKVWPDQASMRQRINHLTGTKRNSLGGCTVSYDRGAKLGEVNLCRPNIGIGMVAHEISHATWGWARRVGLEFKVERVVSRESGEERFACAMQKMIARFVKRAYKLGLY